MNNPNGGTAKYPNRSGIPFCPPPAIKPVDVSRHGQYETGKGSGETQMFQLPSVAWEAASAVSLQPSWLMLMNVVFLQTLVVPAYALIFDLTMTSQEQSALIANGAVARWTLGPVPAGGGSIMWSPDSERIPDDVATNSESVGVPFNFGITVVLSSTPRVLTRIVVGQDPVSGMAITARFKV